MVQLEKIQSFIHTSIQQSVLQSGVTSEMEAAGLPAQEGQRAWTGGEKRNKERKGVFERTVKVLAVTVLRFSHPGPISSR